MMRITIPGRARVLAPALLLAMLGWLSASASAVASEAGTGWEAVSQAYPTNLAPGDSGQLEIDLVNTGAAPSTGAITLTDALPPGVTATAAGGVEVFGREIVTGAEAPWNCRGTAVVTCVSTPFLAPQPNGGGLGAQAAARLRIAVYVAPEASVGTFSNRLTIQGGGAASVARVADPVTISDSPAGFGLANWDVWFSNADGSSDTQAGSHPYTATFALTFSETAQGTSAGGETRDLEVELPPGMFGDPNAVPRCSAAQFAAVACPPQTQVGIDLLGLGEDGGGPPGPGGLFVLPIYNLVPPPGVPDEFAFSAVGFPAVFEAHVRRGADGQYRIVEHLDNIPEINVRENILTLWGVPAEAGHNEQRDSTLEGAECSDGCASGLAPKPFLTLPTSCEGPQPFAIRLRNSWQDDSATAEASVLTHDALDTPSGFTGCEDLTVHPSLSAAPETTAADTPSGVNVEVKVPQEALLQPEGVAASTLRGATVTLPVGVVVDPGAAAGLQACQPAQENLDSEGPAECPSASKVGTVSVATPLLEGELETELTGNVYVLQSNPPNLQLLVAASGDGVNLKLVGDVHMNEETGQLSTTFSQLPALPFTDTKLSFSSGAQAALATPTGCGVYTSTSDFTPSNSPFGEDSFPTSAFQITSGPGGSPCASPPPFAPSMIAGATTDQAGGYTDFSLLLNRADGQQRISKLQFKTPPGLLGMISHVTLCEEPQASRGECPASARIGHTTVGAGPGPYPLYVPEPGRPEAPIYVTGPYAGAPYGLSIVVPVQVGPFNLGTTVVRGRIEVDPLTAQLTITTDPLPTILDGVPVDLRTIDTVIDRGEFMFNPTNCDRQSFSGTAFSTEGATAPLSSPFQVGSCRSLQFKPTFKVSTGAHTSRTDGASLHVTLDLPDEGGLSSEANVRRVKVSLPKQLPTPLKTLQKACLEKTFAENPKDCPLASQVGQVKVQTPVLPGGLSGTAYFVSHGGAKYPELIIVLVGQNGVTEQVHGETFISKQGITTATFNAVPDVPFSSFELELAQREYPAITANGNLCKAQAAGKLAMPTEIAGQNGLVIDQSTKIAVSGCPKVKRAAGKQKGKHRVRHGGKKG
ncbi:MAG TPA: hypothetical protein VNV42_09120 [Solirubrobacteraceae bacterium]|jgi:uncharacterized repeat protein (TIGR01451 family)|nr:hypothetical protein [Solirubrobacteraceae bacterium]